MLESGEFELDIVRDYQSVADSPFPLDNPLYFLEDFEDGEFNTPGYVGRESVIPGPSDALINQRGVAIQPGGLAGDASGLAAEPDRLSLTQLTDATDEARDTEGRLFWDFMPLPNGASGGMLPTELGFAVTAAPAGTTLIVDLVEADAIRFGFLGQDFGVSIDLTDGVDDQPLFVSASFPPGIASVTVSFRLPSDGSGVLPSPVFQIDHVQYGYAVPEPATAVLAALALAAASRRLQPAE